MSDIQVKPLWSEFSYKPHQITAVEWMVNRESMLPSGGILCDEMGLGKTIEVLGLIKSSKVSNTNHCSSCSLRSVGKYSYKVVYNCYALQII